MLLAISFEFILIFTLIAVVGGLFAVIIAIIFMQRNRKRYEQAPEKQSRGEVIKLIMRQRFTDITGLNTDPELADWHYRKGNYLVQILRDDGVFMLLSCDDKQYNKLVTGYYGQFTYKANVLIDSRRNKSRELERRQTKEETPYFFKNRTTKVETIGMFLEAPSFQIKVSADKPLQCDLDEIKNYVNHMLENTGENNFGLINNNLTLQFFNNGKDEVIWIDLIDPQVSGVYQGSLNRFDDLYELIEAFFSGRDIREFIKLEYMELK